MRLITGALPAQYGLHTAGIIDITSKSGAALAGGTVGVYGGSRQTISPYFEYGGVTGQTEYYATGRYLSTGLGLEIPTPTLNGIHDYSEQGRFFSYTSTLLDPSTRLSTIVGVGETRYQIPNNVGQAVNAGGFNGPGGGPFTAWGISDFNSANLNQRQYEKNAYGVVAWQRSVENIDVQLAYYSRYSDLHFVPDPVGDMLFNNVASDVFRSSFLNGISGDGAYYLNEAHTIRAGFLVQGEQTRIKSIATVEALDPADPTGLTALEPPFNISDGSNLFGWQIGAYVQDEWRLTDKLTFNYGLRFDQMFQYVDENQFSPRASFTYKPWWATVFHVGYARNFTPPPQVLGRVFQGQLFNGTTAAATSQNVGSICFPTIACGRYRLRAATAAAMSDGNRWNAHQSACGGDELSELEVGDTIYSSAPRICLTMGSSAKLTCSRRSITKRLKTTASNCSENLGGETSPPNCVGRLRASTAIRLRQTKACSARPTWLSSRPTGSIPTTNSI